MNIYQLIELAKSISSLDSDEELSRAEFYSSSLKSWIDSNPSFFSGNNLSDSDREQLFLLLEQHERVMALVDSYRGSTSLAIKNLKGRGRAIKAYITNDLGNQDK